MNFPNRLTIIRAILIVPFVVLLLGGYYGWAIFAGIADYVDYIALVIFIIASLTDLLDGKIARKYKLITNFGKFMDPLADKLLVCAGKEIYNERLADLYVDENSEDADSTFRPISNPVIALNIVSIEDSGKIVYLNSDLLQYDVPNSWTVTNEDGSSETKNAMFKYHILGGMIPGESQMAKEDIDSYRNTLSSGYSVFKSKTSGKFLASYKSISAPFPNLRFNPLKSQHVKSTNEHIDTSKSLGKFSVYDKST
jgi:hypothetical protein